MTRDDPRWDVTAFVGYANAQPADLIAEGLAKKPAPAGDFVVVGKQAGNGAPAATAIVTSALAARPYFYSSGKDGSFHHGTDVFDVAGRAGHRWTFSRRGLLAYLLLGHTTGTDTLHEHVFRVPADSVLMHAHGRLSVASRGFWDAAEPGASAPTTDPLAEITRELEAGQPSLLSMSAGYDSRLLLSVLTRLGVRPTLGTISGLESGDLAVARSVAVDLGLELREVPVLARDYLPAAKEIVRLTGGSKGAAHWHTFLYARGLRAHDEGPHFVGSNGEFARTFYFDKGAVALAVDRLPQATLQSIFFWRLERRRARLPNIAAAARAHRSEVWELAGRLASLTRPARTTLDALDRSYALQRVRHFIGNGLSLYASQGAPVSPFLDPRWIAFIARLPRGEKLGSQYHRRVIANNDQRLLTYPSNHGAPLTVRRPRGYWLRERTALAGYSPFDEVARNAETQGLLAESPHVAELVLHRRPFDQNEVDLLLPLHFVGELSDT